MYTTSREPETMPQYIPPAPKKHRSWVKWVLGGIAALTVLIVALVAMAIASTASGTNSISSDSSQPAAPAPVHKQTMQEWLSGPGGKALYTVKDDLTQIGTDAGSQDIAALNEDGNVLADDAGTAKALPPPEADVAGHYKHAMRDFIKAGHMLRDGDVFGATTWMANGATQIQQSTDAVK